MTGIISETVYMFLDENEMLPEERNGSKRSSTGKERCLLVDKTILADCKQRHKNLWHGLTTRRHMTWFHTAG